MAWQIVNAESEKKLEFKDSDFPILIHGANGSGASFFTIVMAAQFVRDGESVLFACAHARGIQSLQDELALPKAEIAAKNVTPKNSDTFVISRLIAMHYTDAAKMSKAIGEIRDFRDRVVVLKNAETIMSDELWKMVGTHKRLIVSGDENFFRTNVPPDFFNTVISFSDLPDNWPFRHQVGPKYIGYLRRKGDSHAVAVFVKEKVA